MTHFAKLGVGNIVERVAVVSNDVATTPVVIVGLVIAGLVNKFAIVISLRADASVSNNNKLSPVAGAPPKSDITSSITLDVCSWTGSLLSEWKVICLKYSCRSELVEPSLATIFKLPFILL